MARLAPSCHVSVFAAEVCRIIKPKANEDKMRRHCSSDTTRPSPGGGVTGAMPPVHSAPVRSFYEQAPSGLDAEFDRQMDAHLDRHLDSAISGPPQQADLRQRLHRKVKEARYAHKAEQGVRGMALWRRGWKDRAWATDYMDPALRGRVGSLIWRDFRSEFRIPLEMFDLLVDELRGANLSWARDERIARSGAPPIPLQLKVMSALRVMAIGVPFCAFVHRVTRQDTFLSVRALDG
jgi:hypothetical protein